MDGVILAAGRNERLRGLVAPYHKPLLVVNGVPLILNCVRLALKFCNRVVIVVAPQNVDPICQMLSDAGMLRSVVHVVIQPEARGPGEALWRGLAMCHNQEALVLCGDNVMTEEDVGKIVNAHTECQRNVITMGVHMTNDAEAALRFTRISPEERAVEGGRDCPPWQQDQFMCWLGPLVVPRVEFFNVLTQLVMDHNGPINIGENLNQLELSIKPVVVNCYDIGVPEALLPQVAEVKIV